MFWRGGAAGEHCWPTAQVQDWAVGHVQFWPGVQVSTGGKLLRGAGRLTMNLFALVSITETVPLSQLAT